MDGLTAGSAGLTCGGVEVGDGDGADTDVRAVQVDGGGDGGLFGADGEAVGGVFDVAAGDDGVVGEQESGADAEVTVGGVGVMGGCGSAVLEGGDLLRGEGLEVRAGRHGVSEGTGCGGSWQEVGS